VQLKISLHMKDLDRLAMGVHANPIVSDLISRALRLRQFAGAHGPHIAILCDEKEGRELLDYARVQCPECAEKIRSAFLLNLLTSD